MKYKIVLDVSIEADLTEEDIEMMFTAMADKRNESARKWFRPEIVVTNIKATNLGV